MMAAAKVRQSQLLALLRKCTQLNADIRPHIEKGYFTVTIPPPWDGPASRKARILQNQIKEWSKQYPDVICYCFDSFGTLIYVLQDT